MASAHPLNPKHSLQNCRSKPTPKILTTKVILAITLRPTLLTQSYRYSIDELFWPYKSIRHVPNTCVLNVNMCIIQVLTGLVILR